MSVEWTFTSDFSFFDENFAKIFRFFLLELPVENTSKRFKSFENYGWNSRKITNELKNQINSLNKNWKIIKVKDTKNLEKITQDIENLCKENGILNEVTDRREIFIHTDSKDNKTKSLCYAIRCAFAHGSFDTRMFQGESFYFFENRFRGKLRGRIVVKEKTLLKIIGIITKSNLN